MLPVGENGHPPAASICIIKEVLERGRPETIVIIITVHEINQVGKKRYRCRWIMESTAESGKFRDPHCNIVSPGS